MSLQFDATLKGTVREDPTGYAVRFGLPAGKRASLLNVDLSTLTAATDAAIGVGTPPEEIADLNFQSGPDPKLPSRVLLYNSALHFRYGVPVRSIVVLLRPIADNANLNGLLTYGDANHRLEFHYEVIRLWKEPVDSFLAGSLGLAPLAVLGQLPAERSTEEAIRDIMQQIETRLLTELPRERAVVLMQAAVILASMRVGKNDLSRILQGVGLMGEVAAFDYFVEQSAIRECREMLIEQGRIKFGHPDEIAEAALNSMNDRDRLRRMVKAILRANSWQDLLDTP
jgi:hypothetical protein